jgi:hypothetical protein
VKRATYIVHTPGEIAGEPFVTTKARAKRLIAQERSASYRWLGTTCHVYLLPVPEVRLLAIKVAK